MNENCRYSIGVALTPNHIKISLVNIKKKVIESMRVRHNSDGIENIINLLNENIDLLMKKYNLCSANLLGIGFHYLEP
nr:hypothetical protein [Clostridium sp. MF28]